VLLLRAGSSVVAMLSTRAHLDLDHARPANRLQTPQTLLCDGQHVGRGRQPVALGRHPAQLNLAAIFIATLEEADSDARRAGSLQSLWEVLTEDCSDDERLERMVSTTKAASS
jgi:hypothetical protein